MTEHATIQRHDGVGGSAEIHVDTVIRVLVADPRRLFGEALRACLEQRPEIAVLAVVADVPSAVRAIDAKHPDVVLVGESLGDGLVPATLAAIAPAVPSGGVCVVAGSTSPERVLEAVAAGARGYLTKDKRIADVVDTVLAVGRGEMILPASAWHALSTRIRAFDAREPIRIADSRLTLRESQVARLMAEGRTNRSIASVLQISPETARTHVHRVVMKLHARSRVEAAAVITRELLRARVDPA